MMPPSGFEDRLRVFASERGQVYPKGMDQDLKQTLCHFQSHSPGLAAKVFGNEFSRKARDVNKLLWTGSHLSITNRWSCPLR